MIYKTFPAAIAALALAACSSETPQPVEDGADRAPDKVTQAVAPASDRVTLTGQGLTAGTEAFFFNAGKAEVEASLAKVLGDSTDTGANGECGAGPMEFTTYPGGLTANFQDGKLVGWFLRNAGSEKIATDEGVLVGSSVSDFEQKHGAAAVEGSTLGSEYYSEQDKIGGLAAEGEASGVLNSLYAGTNCFFR